MPWSTSLTPTACPARETLGLIFLLYKQRRLVQAKTSAAGDHQRAVVERIVRFWDSAIGAAGSRVNPGWAFHGENFVRSFLIKFVQEGVELGLLLQEVGAGWASGFFFQGQMHAFMTAVLLGMARPDALDGDA